MESASLLLFAGFLILTSVEVSGDGQCDSEEGTCVVRETDMLTVPCGTQDPRETGVSFSYRLLNGTVLEHEPFQFLQINASRETHNGITVCCSTNVSSYASCYRLNITYPPMEGALTWAVGYSPLQLYKMPFKLICPLEGNPPAIYSWERYSFTDLIEQLELTDDLEFRDDGRSLKIGALTEEHNGVYVCSAVNSLGAATYVNVIDFWIWVSKCDSYSAVDPNIVTIDITPYREPPPSTTKPSFHYPEGSTVRINCTMSPVQHESAAYWYRTNNCSSGMITILDVDPQYSVERVYEYGDCSWSSVLTIKNFTKSLSGDYYCGSCSYRLENQTLSVEVPEVSSLWDPKDPSQLAIAIAASCLACVIIAGLLICVGVVLSRRFSTVPYTTTEEPPAEGFIYDVFISAHDEARDIVQEKLLQPLENDFDPPYKVCWHLRDFIAGLPISEQIAEAVQTSRKVVFVFSEHFAESEFCCLELEHTLHRLLMTRTRCLIPITLSEGAVPRNLRRRITYWPVLNAKEENFVNEITELLGQPIRKEAEESEGEDDKAPLITR